MKNFFLTVCILFLSPANAIGISEVYESEISNFHSFASYTSFTSEYSSSLKSGSNIGVGYSKMLPNRFRTAFQVSTRKFTDNKVAADYAYLEYQSVHNVDYKVGILNTTTGLFVAGATDPFSAKGIIAPSTSFWSSERGIASTISGIGLEYRYITKLDIIFEFDFYYGEYIKQNESVTDIFDLGDQFYFKTSIKKNNWELMTSTFVQNYSEDLYDTDMALQVTNLSLSYNSENFEVIVETMQSEVELPDYGNKGATNTLQPSAINIYSNYWLSSHSNIYASVGGLYKHIMSPYLNNKTSIPKESEKYIDNIMIGSAYILTSNLRMRAEIHRNLGTLPPENGSIDYGKRSWENIYAVSLSYSM
jgi:hypothetical protein